MFIISHDKKDNFYVPQHEKNRIIELLSYNHGLRLVARTIANKVAIIIDGYPDRSNITFTTNSNNTYLASEFDRLSMKINLVNDTNNMEA